LAAFSFYKYFCLFSLLDTNFPCILYKKIVKFKVINKKEWKIKMAKNIFETDDDLLLEDGDELENIDDNYDEKPLGNGSGPKGFVKILIILIIGVVIGGLGFGIFNKIKNDKEDRSSKKRIGVESLFEVKEGSYPLILDGQLSEYRVFEIDGKLYLKRELVVSEIDCRFYYDKESDAILYVDGFDTATFNIGETKYFDSSKRAQRLDYKPVIETENGIYIALDIINFCRTMFTYEIYESPKRVGIWTYEKEGQYNDYVTSKKTVLREGASNLRDIYLDLKAGEKVTLLDDSDKEFYKVLARGVVGYVDSSYLKKNSDVEKFVVNEPFTKACDKVVKMGWAHVTTAAANTYIMENVENTKGLNVISPTWYSISDSFGTVNSICSEATTMALHKAGYEVWPLINDFDSSIDHAALFSSKSCRKNIIAALIKDAYLYGYDGYNVDFEYIDEQSAEGFLQFLREFKVECMNQDIKLSVDNYAPSDRTVCYNRYEQSLVCDYIVLMGYDEHYAGSPEAGSVSSLPFLKAGIDKTIENICESKRLIVALPFYSRLWAINSADNTVSSDAYRMTSLNSLVDEKGLQKTWLPDEGQNYVEYEEEGKLYKAWLEDSESYEVKLDLVSKYEIGGVSFWRLGFEDASIYDVINKYITD